MKHVIRLERSDLTQIIKIWVQDKFRELTHGKTLTIEYADDDDECSDGHVDVVITETTSGGPKD